MVQLVDIRKSYMFENSNPSLLGSSKATKDVIASKNARVFKYNLLSKNQAEKLKKSFNDYSVIVPKKAEVSMETNSYAMSPEVKPKLCDKPGQASHPVINTKLQKNFIFKRVKNRIAKNNKFLKGRVSSAVQRSSHVKDLDTSTSSHQPITRKRIRSLQKQPEDEGKPLLEVSLTQGPI